MSMSKKSYRRGGKDDQNASSMPDEDEIARRAAEIRSTWDKSTKKKRIVEPSPDIPLHEIPSPWDARRGGVKSD